MSPTAAPDPLADSLALAVVSHIRSGMTVGLGTGRAAARGVRTLAAMATRDHLTLTCVSTSIATAALAASLGLRVVDLNNVDRIDILFDGADEVDPHLHMIKGGGGAMTRERIVAHACLASGGQCLYMIDHAKRSPRLGQNRLLPVEVLPLAHHAALRALIKLGLIDPPVGALRRSTDGKPILTDNAHLVLDLTLPAALVDTAAATATLAKAIKSLPGVLDHGLFVDECSTLFVEDASGIVSTQHK